MRTVTRAYGVVGLATLLAGCSSVPPASPANGSVPLAPAAVEISPAQRAPAAQVQTASREPLERAPATPEGQLALAKRYAAGDGVELDMVQAGYVAQVAARHGSDEAARFIEKQASKSAIVRLYLGSLQADGPPIVRNPAQSQSTYDSAIAELRTLADRGTTGAMVALGLAYQLGKGLKLDKAEALRWFERAAKAGHPKANSWMSTLYSKGEGVPKDERLAAEYARKAADAGDVDGAFSYALMLENGKGVTQSQVSAFNYYRKAAEGGLPGAQNNLAYLLEKGDGVGRDVALARHWYERAAHQRSPAALFNLGRCYDEGLGGERDPKRARELWQQAAEAGWPAAKERLARLAQHDKCLEQAETKLFEVAIACSDRDELRAAVLKAGAKPVRVDDQYWYDNYASGDLLRGSTELSLGYNGDRLFAEAIYKLIPDDETASRITQMVTSKYGQPKVEKVIDGQKVDYPRLSWKRKDGIEMTLLRSDSAMMLLYTHPEHKAQVRQEQKESDDRKRQREQERESNAF